MSREKLDKLRMFIMGMGILCLVISLFLLFRNFLLKSQETDVVSQPVDATHRVLFICSYDPHYFTHDYQIQGLTESLYPKGIEFDVIYMHAKKYGTETDLDEFYQYLKSRVNRRLNTDRYEAIVAADDQALLLLLNHDDDFLPDIPVVFFGINGYELAIKAQDNPRYTGFYEMDYLGNVLKLAVELFPEKKRLVALHDNSEAGMADMKLFNSFAATHSKLICEDIDCSKVNQAVLIDKLESIGDDAILFYMTAFSDVYGNTYSMPQRTHTIIAHTAAPIFRNYVGGVGQGILGSVYMDMRQQSYDAGERTAQILEGAKPSDFALDMETPRIVEFDYKLVEEYGLDKNILPEDTVFVNVPETFFTMYGGIMVPMVLLGCFSSSCFRQDRYL